jgi:hypothetical protein
MYYIKHLDMFEHYYAHPQEVKIVFLQHLVSSLSVSGRAVNRLRAVDMPLCIIQHAKRMTVCCHITILEDSHFNL